MNSYSKKNTPYDCPLLLALEAPATRGHLLLDDLGGSLGLSLATIGALNLLSTSSLGKGSVSLCIHFE